MKISRTSPITDKVNEMEIDVTDQQMADYVSGKGLIQHIMPNISADEREFIMSGSTPDDWKAIFPPSCADCADMYVDGDGELVCKSKISLFRGERVANDHICAEFRG